ncbi:hypothetical protein FOZ63_024851, partial [Perkinsus olseni]
PDDLGGDVLPGLADEPSTALNGTGELPRRLQVSECEALAFAESLKSLPVVSEETVSSERQFRETRVVVCGTAQQMECLAKKVDEARSLMREHGSELLGGLIELEFDDGGGLPVCPLDGPVHYQPTATLSSRSIEFEIEGYFQVQGIARNLRDAFGDA